MAGDDARHDPTPAQLRRVRERGQFARSGDLAAAAAAVILLAGTAWFGGGLFRSLGAIGETGLGDATTHVSADDAVELWRSATWRAGAALLPLLFAVAAAGGLVHWMQTGFTFSSPRRDDSRFDLESRLAQAFSGKNAVRQLFSLFKVAIALGIFVVVLWRRRESIAGLSGLPVGELAAQLPAVVLGAAGWMAAALLALGLADYGYARWRFWQDMRLSDAELREELREIEPNPQVVSHRRALHRRTLNRR